MTFVSVVSSNVRLDLIVLEERRISRLVSKNVTGVSSASHLRQILFIVDISNVIAHMGSLSLWTIALELRMSMSNRRMYDIGPMPILHLVIDGRVVPRKISIQVFLLDALSFI